MNEVFNLFGEILRPVTDFLGATMLNLQTASSAVLEMIISFLQGVVNVLSGILSWMGL